MKKVLFIAAASLALFLSSCQKENVQPQNSQNQIALKQTFIYSKTLTIYDETGNYSVDYIVQSDNKEEFDNGVNNFKNMRLKLLYENYVTTKNVTTNTSENKSALPPLDYSNTLFIKVGNVNKGKAIGFELISKPELRGTYVVNGFHSLVWYLPEFANWYRVTNTGSNGFIARDLYSNNCSNYTQSSQVTLSYYSQWHDFSSTNTACRALWITTIQSFKSFSCTVSIY